MCLNKKWKNDIQYIATMNYDPYLIVCNPCNERVVAVDDEQRLLQKNGFKPHVSRQLKHNEYIPIVIYMYYGTIYKCPECESHSGVLAPQNPNDLSLFSHSYICSNRNKIPVEI
jgi:hypothetical protein